MGKSISEAQEREHGEKTTDVVLVGGVQLVDEGGVVGSVKAARGGDPVSVERSSHERYEM